MSDESNFASVEEKLNNLARITNKIDIQTGYVKEKIDSLEEDIKSLTVEYARLTTDLEIVKQDKDYPRLQEEIETIKNHIDRIKQKQESYSMMIHDLEYQSSFYQTKREKVLDVIYKILIIIASTVLLYNFGINP